ncbi:hypothetical protein NQT62_14350 [Limnobacter humi]|uniref:Uncharacterized protein n=1 Tax=Limnobacter humi TaxID=1778671 RepID=A0ABT1WJE2_9BURK|nr:hypothetical protein [Limnobacter humi]MCQ8897619.1 hypothetical protein [Limnobacter humi]
MFRNTPPHNLAFNGLPDNTQRINNAPIYHVATPVQPGPGSALTQGTAILLRPLVSLAGTAPIYSLMLNPAEPPAPIVHLAATALRAQLANAVSVTAYNKLLAYLCSAQCSPLTKQILCDLPVVPNDKRHNLGLNNKDENKAKVGIDIVNNGWMNIRRSLHKNVADEILKIHNELLGKVLTIAKECIQFNRETQSDPDLLFDSSFAKRKKNWIEQKLSEFLNRANQATDMLKTGICDPHLVDVVKSCQAAIASLYLMELMGNIKYRLDSITPEVEMTKAWVGILDEIDKSINSNVKTIHDIQSHSGQISENKLKLFTLGNKDALKNRYSVATLQDDRASNHESDEDKSVSLCDILDLKLPDHKTESARQKIARMYFTSLISKTAQAMFFPDTKRSLKKDGLPTNGSHVLSLYYENLRSNMSFAREYPVAQWIQTLLVNRPLEADVQGASSSAPRQEFAVFDCCAGWGNRIYAAVGLLSKNYIQYLHASDPNMSSNGIEAHLKKHLQKEGIPGVNQDELFQQINLDDLSISDNLTKALSNKFDKQFDLLATCPPYANTLLESERTQTNKVNVVFERYDNCTENSEHRFVEEFGIKLGALAAILIKANGACVVQFNSQHALVFANIIESSGFFSNVRLAVANDSLGNKGARKSKATTYAQLPLIDRVLKHNQMYVIATRNTKEARQPMGMLLSGGANDSQEQYGYRSRKAILGKLHLIDTSEGSSPSFTIDSKPPRNQYSADSDTEPMAQEWSGPPTESSKRQKLH